MERFLLNMKYAWAQKFSLSLKIASKIGYFELARCPAANSKSIPSTSWLVLPNSFPWLDQENSVVFLIISHPQLTVSLSRFHSIVITPWISNKTICIAFIFNLLLRALFILEDVGCFWAWIDILFPGRTRKSTPHHMSSSSVIRSMMSELKFVPVVLLILTESFQDRFISLSIF